MERSRRKRPVSLRTSSGAFVQARTKRSSNNSRSMISLIRPSASAASVPGRTGSHTSAWRASMLPGIDNNHVRAFGATLGNRVCLREPSISRIMPPQKDRVRVLVVRRRHPAAEGEGMREIFMPVTNLGGIANVGRQTFAQTCSIQSMLSDKGVPLGVVTPKTTASAPCSARMLPSFQP